jgi:hypothetical protein
MEHLLANRSIRITHLTRRNLLRRLVSERQARATNQWTAGHGANVDPRPPVVITMRDLVDSIRTTEARQAEFDSTFRDHPVLRLIHEDLAGNPQRVACEPPSFLDCPNG